MALKRLLWTGVPLVVAAGLAVALLPPRPLPEEPGTFSRLLGLDYWNWGWNGLRVGQSVADRDVAVALDWLGTKVARAHRADSLLALAQHAGHVLRSSDGLIEVLYDPSFPLVGAQSLLRDAERELALYPRADGPGMPVIVAIYSDSARHQDLAHRWWRQASFVREGPRGSACFVELNYLQKLLRERPRRVGSPLNECALYARYGARGVSDAHSPALPGGLADEYYRSTLTDALMGARRHAPARVAPWEWRPEWAPFDMDPSPIRHMPPVMWQWSACLAGSGPWCLPVARLDAARVGRTVWWWGIPSGRQALFGDLLANGDVRRFAAFWRSDLPAAQALEAAYARPAAAIVRDAMRRQWTVQGHGPQVTASVLSAAAGWILAALGLAVVAGRRRQARS